MTLAEAALRPHRRGAAGRRVASRSYEPNVGVGTVLPTMRMYNNPKIQIVYTTIEEGRN